MDDLSSQVSRIFRRYKAEFHRLERLSDSEYKQAIQLFRKEVAALISEHGGEAVVRTALALSTKPPSLH
jgi:hypothetical protein